MSLSYCRWLLILAVAFCLGCGDSSPQPWENGKSPAGKPKTTSGEVADNDTAGGAADNAREITGPHAENPHAGLPVENNAADKGLENDGKLDLGNVNWTVPKSWIRKRPNMMLKAEYAIPRSEGDQQEPRLTISQVGGTVEGNFARWKKQFGGKPDKDKQEDIDVGGVKVTLLDLAGTFDDPGNMTGPPVSRPDYRMLGATFEISGEEMPYYIKCYGPAKTMSAHADDVKAFIRSMKVEK